MKRQEKELVVQSLREGLTENKAVFVVGYKGLTVAQTEGLRKKVRAKGGAFKVAKARLIKHALESATGMADMIPLIKDQIGVVFVQQEAAPVAKVLCDFAKENNALQVVIGFADAQVMNSKQIQMLASLPSREVLLAQLCGVLLAPMAALARVIKLAQEKVETQS